MQPGVSPQSRAVAAGSLTAVMRAARADLAPNVPLVLRIGVVRGGRIVEERVVKQRTTVSIGESEDATFVCASPRFELFARRKDGYVLRFTANMTGRLALTSGVTTLEALRSGGIFEVPLGDDARGKVSVGDTTFLFQFVRPPPPQPRPQLPLAVKAGLTGQIDWSLTIIAALSFLLHFGIVGAMYSDWMDVTVDDGHSVAGLVDLMKNIPPPATTETPNEPVSDNVTAPPTKTNTTSSTPSKSNGSPSHAPGATASRSMSANEAAALADRASKMEIDLLAGINNGPSVKGALNRSDIPPVDLSARAQSADGIAHGGSDLHLAQGGPPVTGRNNGGLATMAGDTHGTANTNAGDTRTIAAPKIDAQIGMLGGGVTVSGADRVVAGLRSRFKACYQKGLNADPTMSGKAVIGAKIAPNGEVSSADIVSNQGLSAEVTSCLVTAVKRAQFDAQPTATTLNIPVSFVKQ